MYVLQMRRHLKLLVCVALLFVMLVSWAAEGGSPDFELPLRGAHGKSLRLYQERGRVVVLDFFAHWCAPCIVCTAEIETGVARYYEERKGNSRGVPVEVFAVNVETAQPDKTGLFILRTGMQRVLEDAGGKVFEKYGGTGLPYVVVIDATGGDSGTAPPRTIYSKAGWEGLDQLRQVIDSVGFAPVAVKPDAQGSSESALHGSPPQVQVPRAQGALPEAGPHSASVVRPNKAVIDFAALVASDILLTDTLLEYQRTLGRSFWAVGVSEGHIGLDYVPETRLEDETNVTNDRFGAQARGRFQATDRLTFSGEGGTYYGFMEYRSLWFDEHFRQLYSRRPGYQKAHPWGYNTSAGLRWEYLPACGYLQGDLAWQQDVISPGYEVRLLPFPPQLIRFQDKYDTLSGLLTLENVLTPRLRAREELLITDTTDRHLRYSLQGSLNFAIADHWVTRLALSGTEEAPQFESWSTGATLEHDWNDTWFISVTGRYYQDTGQIENALLPENTAAPPLQTVQIGIGLRWQGATSSAKIVVGPYFSRYEAPSGANLIFGHLYENRDWISAQFAFAHEF